MKVFALGGSVINQNFSELNQLANALEENEPFIAVVGAGHLKKHQDAVRDHVTKAETDLVGIAATRLNAKTVQTLLDDPYPSVPKTVEQVREAVATEKNVVMGGLNPGFSTDAVAAVLAETFDADLYIVTDVDGIYTENPEEDPDAERLDNIKAEKLLEMTSGKNEPGVYSIVDETAVGIIQRSGLKTKLFEGTVENLENPKDAEGTYIKTE